MSATDVLGSIAAARNRWEASAVAGRSPLEALAYRSNLLGADRALANIGGGNTSVKETITDHVGRQVRVLWVKGSGTDLATITAAGFAGLRLDELLPARGAVGDGRRERWSTTCSGAACVRTSRGRRSRRCSTHSCLRLTSTTRIPTPSIALTSTPSGRRLASRDLRRRSGLARLPAAGLRHVAPDRPSPPTTIRRHERCCSSKHGLVTWGETGEESYESTIEFVARAARAVDGGRAGSGWAARGSRSSGTRTRVRSSRRLCLRSAARCSPTRTARARGRPESGGSRVRVLGARARGEPDRRTLPRPSDSTRSTSRSSWTSTRRSDGAVELAAAFRRGVDEYSAWYREYYARSTSTRRRGQFPIDPAGPRVMLVPGVGIVTTGSDAGRARVARDLYHRAIAVEERCRRTRRLPLAQRGGGVRDRVLAARALQARSGAAARRARGPDRADHRRRKRDRPGLGARCLPNAARTSSSPT